MKPSPFLNEVIGCFADRDGIIPLRRGDAYTLFREAGYTPREADCRAFAPYVRKLDCEPWSLADARTEVLA